MNKTTKMTDDQLERTIVALPRAPAAALLIYHGGGPKTVPLVQGEPVIVGRDEPADVVVRDFSLSRRHARFELDHDGVWIEDLGSTNGTRVNGDAVKQRSRVEPGADITIGAVAASLHLLRAGVALEGLHSHDRWSLLLAWEVRRFELFRQPFALMMICRAPESTEEAEPLGRWWGRASGALRRVDQVGLYSSDTIEVLLPQVSEAEALEIGERVVANAGLLCGLAAYPSSATSADALVTSARDALHSCTVSSPLGAAPALASTTRIDLSPAEAEDGPIVRSPVMKEIFDHIDRLVDAKITVLIRGETGTGKEVLARAVHERCGRREGPMCRFNCGAVPQELVESALFGHVAGAFTNAIKDRAGIFESANRGTLFLDEVGELPAKAQVALLRVLEDGCVTPVGGTKEIPVDVHVVAATHRDLRKMCGEGTFREDLFWRLNGIELVVPPLRERPEEIEPLARYLVQRANEKYKRRATAIAPEALQALRRHLWPGNVRELRNAIDRAVVICRNNCISLEDLPEQVRGCASSTRGWPTAPDTNGTSPATETATEEGQRSYWQLVEDYEIRLITEALRECNDSIPKAASQLDMSERTLRTKCDKFGLSGKGSRRV